MNFVSIFFNRYFLAEIADFLPTVLCLYSTVYAVMEAYVTKVVFSYDLFIYMVFRKKHPLVFSCITLRKSNQFESKFQTK